MLGTSTALHLSARGCRVPGEMAQTLSLCTIGTGHRHAAVHKHRACLLHGSEAVMSATYMPIQGRFLNLFQRIILGELAAAILKQANPINNQRELSPLSPDFEMEDREIPK